MGNRVIGIEAMQRTLFDKYGGFSAISKIVMDLYDRLLEDDEVGPFFDDVDMARIVDHQTKFVSSLMDGPASYSDSQIEKLHAHLAIASRHFDQLATILRDTLLEHGISNEDAEIIVGRFTERRDLVVNS